MSTCYTAAPSCVRASSVAVGMLTLLATGIVQAGAQPAASTPKPAPAPEAKPKVEAAPAPTVERSGMYIPPPRGAAGSRVGAATRGTTALFALAPAHVGLTTKAQPILYWFVANAALAPITIDLVRVGTDAPLMRVEIAPPIAAGYHRVALADHGVELDKGVVYEWRIHWPKKGLECLAAITRAEPDEALRSALREAADAPDTLWTVYARHGVWYDAVAELGRRIEQSPEDDDLVSALTALAAQVGLGAGNP